MPTRFVIVLLFIFLCTCKSTKHRSETKFIVLSEESASNSQSLLMKHIINTKPLKILVLDAEKYPWSERDEIFLKKNPFPPSSNLSANENYIKYAISTALQFWTSPLLVFEKQNMRINTTNIEFVFKKSTDEFVYFDYNLTIKYLPENEEDKEGIAERTFACRTQENETLRNNCINEVGTRSYYKEGKELIVWRNPTFATLVHEIGHAFGLADTYVDQHKENQPKSLMKCSYQDVQERKLDFTADDILGIAYTFCSVHDKICSPTPYKIFNKLDYNKMVYLDYYPLFSDLELLLAKYNLENMSESSIETILKRFDYLLKSTRFKISQSLNNRVQQEMNAFDRLEPFQFLQKFSKLKTHNFLDFMKCIKNSENSYNYCLDRI